MQGNWTVSIPLKYLILMPDNQEAKCFKFTYIRNFAPPPRIFLGGGVQKFFPPPRFFSVYAFGLDFFYLSNPSFIFCMVRQELIICALL